MAQQGRFGHIVKPDEAWLAKQRGLWERRLDRLEDYLAELQGKGKKR